MMWHDYWRHFLKREENWVELGDICFQKALLSYFRENEEEGEKDEDRDCASDGGKVQVYKHQGEKENMKMDIIIS